MALELQPNWPKGFFRKGKALWGLKVAWQAEGLQGSAQPRACPSCPLLLADRTA